ncbi:hypothetical protein LCGC14_0263770 [marine sediment metagenome]|uniref:Uncharacterized protein n=1 Tax=marine sediment metagenome TaxID=412755 RepID=A0A0F9X5K0_9ZZZZ
MRPAKYSPVYVPSVEGQADIGTVWPVGVMQRNLTLSSATTRKGNNMSKQCGHSIQNHIVSSIEGENVKKCVHCGDVFANGVYANERTVWYLTQGERDTMVSKRVVV